MNKVITFLIILFVFSGCEEKNTYYELSDSEKLMFLEKKNTKKTLYRGTPTYTKRINNPLIKTTHKKRQDLYDLHSDIDSVHFTTTDSSIIVKDFHLQGGCWEFAPYLEEKNNVINIYISYVEEVTVDISGKDTSLYTSMCEYINVIEMTTELLLNEEQKNKKILYQEKWSFN